jgi:hypothetical protein
MPLITPEIEISLQKQKQKRRMDAGKLQSELHDAPIRQYGSCHDYYRDLTANRLVGNNEPGPDGGADRQVVICD